MRDQVKGAARIDSSRPPALHEMAGGRAVGDRKNATPVERVQAGYGVEHERHRRRFR
jgi:hypothetical protein